MPRCAEAPLKGPGRNFSSFFRKLSRTPSRGVPENCLRTLTRMKRENFSFREFRKGEIPRFSEEIPTSSTVKGKGSPKIVPQKLQVAAHRAGADLKESSKAINIRERTTMNLSRKTVQPEKERTPRRRRTHWNGSHPLALLYLFNHVRFAPQPKLCSIVNLPLPEGFRVNSKEFVLSRRKGFPKLRIRQPFSFPNEVS